MATLQDADAPFQTATAAHLRGCGFTDAQAAAVATCVRTSTSEAVEGLRHELAHWHAYLALYLLAQIGIVLLATLVMTDLPLTRPMATNAKRANDALSVGPDSRSETPFHRLN